ncbi:hypothetical protein GCM10011588_71610 [Nocardia jinanensis]|uniref:Uncharacterized protein n=1 Tax=Nocardia jinanensis TaxID=382504 RepID=A0A917RZE9_9NOCA|nr:hypothetical protein GCM10011588_71610 [Nocardia jinanensis]
MARAPLPVGIVFSDEMAVAQLVRPDGHLAAIGPVEYAAALVYALVEDPTGL